MARVKRLERIVALTKELTDKPFQLFHFPISATNSLSPNPR